MNMDGVSVSGLDRLSKSWVGYNSITAVAEALRWSGCYGFNRLLHEHTYYPRYSIFKHSQDISYSDRYYCTGGEAFESNRTSIAFCPDCVRGDLDRHGFSYWRRIAYSDIGVCAIHNVKLLRECPYCERGFGWKGHDLDVMWRGCSGRHLGEAVSVKNESDRELRRSQILHDGFLFDGIIPIEDAVSVLSERVRAGKLIAKEFPSEISVLKDRLDASLVSIWRRESESNGDWQHDSYSGLVWEGLNLLYGSFGEFVEDLSLNKCKFRKPSSLWSTYRAGGMESAHYVEEDYSTGVGIWSCPYPSPLSEIRRRNLNFCRPIIYHCCNFQPPRRKGHQLSPMWCRPAPPRVPKLERMEGTFSRLISLPASAGAY